MSGGVYPGTTCSYHLLVPSVLYQCWLMRLCMICQLRPLACPRVLQAPVVALVANMAQHAGLSLGEVGGTFCPELTPSDWIAVQAAPADRCSVRGSEVHCRATQ